MTFQKKSKTGRHQDAKARDRPHKAPTRQIEGNAELTDDIEIVRGSGNVFRDFGHQNADLEQLKSIIAVRIIGVLDDRDLSARRARATTGIAAADFSRIRNAQLDRFIVDRLMTILNRLDQRVKVQVSVRPLPKRVRA